MRRPRPWLLLLLRHSSSALRCVRVHAISDLHVDHDANLDFVRSLERPTGDGFQALVVAGDVSADLGRTREALSALAAAYDRVFYVPGNHEAWVTKGDRDAGLADSLAKLEAAEAAAAACGCAPDLPGEPDPADRRSFARRWADFRRCRWPAALLGAAGGDARPHGLGAGDAALSRHFAASNDVAGLSGPLVTFSHFSPRRECVPEKRFLLEPSLAKVSGSDDLGRGVAALRPDVHVFGHTHIPVDLDLDGTYHVQWPLGSPREQARQCARVRRHGPLEIYATDRGVARLGSPGALERTAWGEYYATHDRDPAATELAPWVQACRLRRNYAPAKARVPRHAGYDDDVRKLADPDLTETPSIVSRLEGWHTD
ncbi:calcineurin-like phosphoesterase [Aureococcus anophagefferens]|nr:calcineurin-like phosphoesterase [Aureococcus anophagefferens]